MSGKGDAASDRATVTIFDVHNKFIAFTAPLPNAEQIISEWGTLLILTKDKVIHQLVEKDLHSKLDILFKKNLYDVAIRLVIRFSFAKKMLLIIMVCLESRKISSMILKVSLRYSSFMEIIYTPKETTAVQWSNT